MVLWVSVFETLRTNYIHCLRSKSSNLQYKVIFKKGNLVTSYGLWNICETEGTVIHKPSLCVMCAKLTNLAEGKLLLSVVRTMWLFNSKLHDQSMLVDRSLLVSALYQHWPGYQTRRGCTGHAYLQ